MRTTADCNEPIEFELGENNYVNVKNFWCTADKHIFENAVCFARIFCVFGEGKAWYETKDIRLPFKNEHLYILPVATKYSFYYDEGLPVNILYAHVGLKNATIANEFIEIDINERSEYKSMVEILKYIVCEGKDTHNIKNIISIIITIINDRYGVIRTNEKFINSIITYISENLSEPLSNRQLAEYVQYGEKYITSAFKKSVGVSLHNYVLYVKMLEAQKYISSGMKIKNVIEKLGFLDEKNFCRAFKKINGLTPSQYKKSSQNGCHVTKMSLFG